MTVLSLNLCTWEAKGATTSLLDEEMWGPRRLFAQARVASVLLSAVTGRMSGVPHSRGPFSRFSRRSQKLERARAGEPPGSPKAARPPPRSPRAAPAVGAPRGRPGSAPTRAASGGSLLLLKDERGHGRLCRSAGTADRRRRSFLAHSSGKFSGVSRNIVSKKD